MLALNGGTPIRTRPWPAWPERGPDEVAALTQVIESGRWGGYPAPGPEAERFAQRFARFTDSKHVVMAANGTVTLKVILRALGVGAGDEVIVPALTWVATAGAPAYLNAVPVFVDVDPDTLCIDPNAVRSAIGPKTRAVIAVHLGSTMAEVDALSTLCNTKGLALIEDCAHAHGMRWMDRSAGAFGAAGSFSFQSSKLITSGEGGAITTSDDTLRQKCQSLVNCGRKEGDYASWEGELFGWNDRITELQAALLTAQLGRFDRQRARRAENLARFENRLAAMGDVGLRIQAIDARVTQRSFYQLVLLYDASRWKGLPRDRFVAALEAEGVPADGGFYVPIPDRVHEIFPLKASDYPEIRRRYGEALRPEHAPCPVATRAAYEQTVWLHHSLFLGEARDVDDMLDAIAKIRERVDALL